MAYTGVKVMDYTPQVMRQPEGNKRRALTALGMEAVSQIQNGMDTLYGKPIWAALLDRAWSRQPHNTPTFDISRHLYYTEHIFDAGRYL